MPHPAPQTPRRRFLHPAPLTGCAQTRNVGFAARARRFPYTHGCRVQHFRFCCTNVAAMLQQKNKQNQGFSQQVQRCNGFARKSLAYARTHTHTRAHTTHIYRCTVAPLHKYYKALISLKVLLQRRCNAFVAPLHLATARWCKPVKLACLNSGKSLFSFNMMKKPFVYRGFIG